MKVMLRVGGRWVVEGRFSFWASTSDAETPSLSFLGGS
jgi:hypothetical protein